MVWCQTDGLGNLTGGTASSQVDLTFVWREENDVELLKIAKLQKMSEACAAAITANFQDDTLVPGTPYTYPSLPLDQFNLNAVRDWASVVDGGRTYNFWCADETGAWARRAHTDVQITAIALARADFIASQQDKYAGKLLLIDAATTQAELDLITW